MSNELGLEFQAAAAYIGTGQGYLLVVTVHQDDCRLALSEKESLASACARLTRLASGVVSASGGYHVHSIPFEYNAVVSNDRVCSFKVCFVQI